MRKRFSFADVLWRKWFGVEPPDLQDKRKQFLERLIGMGVFHKIELHDSMPHLWVRSAFHALDFDSKSEFVNVVFAYYVAANPNSNVVLLFDSQTGKKIGKYAEVYGGLKLD